MDAWDYAQPFVLQQRVADEHLDAMQHTNNVVYLSWIEMVAWAHSHALGLDFSDYQRLGAGIVARRHEIDYLAPTRRNDEIELATWIIARDRLSLHRAYQFRRRGDGLTVLRARTHWVCVDMQTGRPRRMPEEFIVAYQVQADAHPL